MKPGIYKTKKRSIFDSGLNMMNTLFNPLTLALTASVLPYTNLPINNILKTLKIIQLISSGVGGVTQIKDAYNILKHL